MFFRLKKNSLCGKGASLFFCFYNVLLALPCFFQKKRSQSIHEESPKILLCCFASLGDVLLASYSISPLKKRWPKARIGFLCSPISASMLQIVKDVDFIHTIPYWMKKQSKLKNLFSLFYHSLFIYPQIAKEIQGIKYDLSIELHPFFPNTIPIAKRARIPRRIGFGSGGYDILLTDPVDLPEKREYLPFLYRKLLAVLESDLDSPKASLEIPFSQKIANEIKGRSFILLQMGTSDCRKEWAPEYWHAVAIELVRLGFFLVFTGKGAHDIDLWNKARLEGLGVNLIDALDLAEFAFLLRQAKAVISVDSFPVHLAAILQVPFVALYLYSESIEFWLPEDACGSLLVKNECVRKNSKKNHPRASYLDKISPLDVLLKVKILLEEVLVL